MAHLTHARRQSENDDEPGSDGVSGAVDEQDLQDDHSTIGVSQSGPDRADGYLPFRAEKSRRACLRGVGHGDNTLWQIKRAVSWNAPRPQYVSRAPTASWRRVTKRRATEWWPSASIRQRQNGSITSRTSSNGRAIPRRIALWSFARRSPNSKRILQEKVRMRRSTTS